MLGVGGARLALSAEGRKQEAGSSMQGAVGKELRADLKKGCRVLGVALCALRIASGPEIEDC